MWFGQSIFGGEKNTNKGRWQYETENLMPPYIEAVLGNLLYFENTRGNTTHGSRLLAQFMHKPGMVNFGAKE